MPSVTGPFFYSDGWPHTGDKSIYASRTWYRSQPRGRVPLPYSGRVLYRVRNTGNYNYHSAFSSIARQCVSVDTVRYQDILDSVHNKALAKLRKEITDFTQQGENLGQAGSTMRMVGDRLNQIAKGYRALRKGRFGDFCDVMRVHPKKKDRHLLNSRRRVQKQASSLFLEYHYGWTPLVNDIYSGINALVDEPIWDRRIKASAQSGSFPLTGSIGPYEQHSGTGNYSSRLRVTIRVTDKNLYAANKVGLINPLQIAWQLVPFSFIVDWFVNVEQYLGSLTDWCGLGTRDPMTSDKLTATSVDNYTELPFEQYSETRGYALRRFLALPEVVLRVTEWKGLSVTRAAVSAALVVQLMSGKAGNRVV